jgi:hypothetical protein
MSELDHGDVPELYIALWKIAVLIVVFSFLTLIGTLAVVRTPAYAFAALGNPLLYLAFAFFMTIALGAFFYRNRANLP